MFRRNASEGAAIAFHHVAIARRDHNLFHGETDGCRRGGRGAESPRLLREPFSGEVGPLVFFTSSKMIPSGFARHFLALPGVTSDARKPEAAGEDGRRV